MNPIASSHRSPLAASRPLAALALAAGLLGNAPCLTAQPLQDASRLSGVDRVQVRVEAEWDEAITMEAGGATGDQFEDALRQTFEESIGGADAAPSLVAGSATTVACHVDTYYETGQIIYSLRAQLEVPGDGGEPVVTWLKSWVGSFPVQQMHRMFTLGEQCAEFFLDDWRSAN